MSVGICGIRIIRTPWTYITIRIFVFLIHLSRAWQSIWLPTFFSGINKNVLDLVYYTFRIIPRGVGSLP